jgi:membrane fusion protein (multidrug efflux system)
MSGIVLELATETIPGKILSKQRIKRMLSAGLTGFFAQGAARHGYDWWNVGRFIESTDDAYAGGNVTPISPHVAGFVAQILVADNKYVRAGQPRHA